MVKRQDIKIATDIRLVANGDQWGAVAELEDGTEIPIWAVNGNDETPPWLLSEKVYEDWYNRALEEAHKQKVFLEGEIVSIPNMINLNTI